MVKKRTITDGMLEEIDSDLWQYDPAAAHPELYNVDKLERAILDDMRQILNKHASEETRCVKENDLRYMDDQARRVLKRK